MISSRKYFETFDALRFLAFFMVFLSHTPLKNIPFIQYFTKSGGLGVSFFFVLSGFLISYILLHEKINTKKINLKKFFIRRALRIWPLFYLLILFAWATPYILEFLHLNSSNVGYKPNWLASLFFLENYLVMYYNEFANVSPLGVMWSLCIEEHFYLLWGFLFYTIPFKKTPWLIFGSILIANLSRIIYSYFSLSFVDVFTNLDFFAYGTLAAYVLVSNKSFIFSLEKISPYIKKIISIITIGLVVFFGNINNNFYNYFIPTILGLLFSFVLIFTLPLKNRLYISSSNFLSKWGKYTYGLYLYHTICIVLILQLNNKFLLISNNILNAIMVTCISFILSLIISYISYHFFEKHFIKLKKHFY